MWDFGDGNTSTAQNPIHEYPNDGEYIVTLNVHPFRCVSDSVTKEITKPIEPNSQPNFDVPTVNPLLLIGMLGFAVVFVLRRKED